MRLLSCVFAALFATGASAAPAFDPKPWLADLDEMRAALSTRYANLEWLVVDRGADLNEYFARAKRRIERAQDAGTARNAFDLLVRRIGDGHIDIDWPQPPGPPSAAVAPVDPCASAGYDATKLGAPLAALMPGYEALGGEPFPAGIIRVGARRVGILKIGLFSAEGMPELCRSARQALGIAPGAPCDDDCQGRIDKAAEERMNDGFIATLEALKAARPDALLVDVTGNGGGSEWVEAVARMLTPKRLKSGRIGFLRGAQWSKELADAESDLREAAKTASPGDRAFLLGLADAAKAKRAVAQTPCDAAPLWRGERPACTWLGEGFYASGLVDSADPKTLEGKPWAARVFTPMEHPYREGLWQGPLFVLVDQETWSAAEEFAAVLQDNRAATVIGEVTGGAGCGHTDGSEPVTLSHSGAKLSLPDCARLRADGSNEVRGIVPDVPLPWGRHDGPRLRAAALAAKLPELLARP